MRSCTPDEVHNEFPRSGGSVRSETSTNTLINRLHRQGIQGKKSGTPRSVISQVLHRVLITHVHEQSFMGKLVNVETRTLMHSLAISALDTTTASIFRPMAAVTATAYLRLRRVCSRIKDVRNPFSHSPPTSKKSQQQQQQHKTT